MPKATPVVSIPVSQTSSSAGSESHPLVSIGLFCGIGLLVSLVSVLMGVQGAWW